MSKQSCNKHGDLIETFNPLEKILLRVGFYGFMIIGAYGIYSNSIVWGLIYTGFVIFGSKFGLLYFLCSHCPYPYKHSDCLFVPSSLIKKQYEFRSDKMSVLDNIGFVAIMAGFIVIPQYWLFKNYTILILFWILCLPTLASFPFYLCRRCQHFDCPFNSVSDEIIKETGET